MPAPTFALSAAAPALPLLARPLAPLRPDAGIMMPMMLMIMFVSGRPSPHPACPRPRLSVPALCSQMGGNMNQMMMPMVRGVGSGMRYGIGTPRHRADHARSLPSQMMMMMMGGL